MRKEGYNGEFLSSLDIIEIHNQVLENAGMLDTLNNGRFIDGTGNAFDMAVNSVFAGFGGYDMHPSIVDKATALCFNIIINHVFRDGNKRTATISMLTMVDLNNLCCTLNDSQLVDLVTRVATKEIDYNDFNQIINENVILKVPKYGQIK